MLCRRAAVRSSLIATLVLAGSVSAAIADPPGRVARISLITGSVSFRPASLDEWSSASLNHPLTIGDHLWVESRSRTELQLGSAVVRLGPSSEFSILNLDDSVVQLRLTQGSLALRVRTLDPDEVVEIDTPSGAVSLVRPGFYRVDVNDGGDVSTVTVRTGEADIAADGPAVPVLSAQTVVLSGLDGAVSDVRASSPTDEFEDWCLARDRHAESAGSARYVSRDMIGYEDLDDHGTWQMAPDYGPVWIPRVRAEWVPYRFGHWAWVEPWGWTWIDDASWGFAPFHYGRWVRLQAGWGWMPGTIVARPVYAPALVAFVGGNSWQGSLSVGPEPIAWFPLGPREVFVPGYRVSPAYARRINVTHVSVTNITVNTTNVTYVNRDAAGAVTAVPRDVFVRGRAIGAVGVAVPRESVRSAVVVGTAAVAPQRASLVGQVVARAAAPPPAAATRPVVVRRTPPPAPVPFAARQAALAAQPGIPIDEDGLKSLRAQVPPAAQQPLVRPARTATVRPARENQNQTTAPPPNPARPAAPPAVRPAPPAQPATAVQRPTSPATPSTPSTPAQPAAPSPAPAPTTTPGQTPAQRPAPSTAPAPPVPARAPAPAPSPAQAAAPRANPPAQASPRANDPAAAQERAARTAALAERHSKEAAEIQARHAAERAQLQARHQQEEQQTTDAHAKQQIRQRHQEEMKALQERHRAEREAVQKRQQEDRKPQ